MNPCRTRSLPVLTPTRLTSSWLNKTMANFLSCTSQSYPPFVLPLPLPFPRVDSLMHIFQNSCILDRSKFHLPRRIMRCTCMVSRTLTFIRKDMKTLPSSPVIQILLDCLTITAGIKLPLATHGCHSTKTRLIGTSNNNDIRPSMLFLFIYLNCILTCPFSSPPLFFYPFSIILLPILSRFNATFTCYASFF